MVFELQNVEKDDSLERFGHRDQTIDLVPL